MRFLFCFLLFYVQPGKNTKRRKLGLYKTVFNSTSSMMIYNEFGTSERFINEHTRHVLQNSFEALLRAFRSIFSDVEQSLKKTMLHRLDDSFSCIDPVTPLGKILFRKAVHLFGWNDIKLVRYTITQFPVYLLKLQL